MRKIAISACLLGEKCRYDASDNKNETLLALLDSSELISFCPEHHAFGTPRPTMDLVVTSQGIRALSHTSGADLTLSVQNYAKDFFDTYFNIDLLIGKDRSPSCGVCSAKLYDEDKNLLSTQESGIMVQEAKKRNIVCIDAEDFKG